MKIGLTGGLASGKSTVADLLAARGAEIVDADRIAHQLMDSGTEVYTQVVDSLGTEILDSDGEIDRQQLGQLVFASAQAKQKLEEITHPYIIQELKERLARSLETTSIVVAEVPLLIEADLMDLFARIWVVYTTKEVQIKRLMAREGYEYQPAKSRVESQLPLDKKVEYADRVIDNNRTEAELVRAVDDAWQELKEEITD